METDKLIPLIRQSCFGLVGFGKMIYIERNGQIYEKYDRDNFRPVRAHILERIRENVV